MVVSLLSIISILSIVVCTQLPRITFYASRFIYMYRVFSCTSIVEIITYMYVLFIFPYINRCNHNNFFFPQSLVGDYYIQFFVIFINLASVRWNPTKPAIRGSPCDIMIMTTNTIIATDPYHIPLWPTSPTPSSSRDTFPQSHSSHQESGTRRNCYSQWGVMSV